VSKLRIKPLPETYASWFDGLCFEPERHSAHSGFVYNG